MDRLQRHVWDYLRHVLMTGTRSVTANFTLKTYTLTTVAAGTGSGTLSASGLSCSGPSCSGTYSYNTSVTLNASAARGSSFSGWTGCDSSAGNACTVTVTGTKSVTASFTLNTYTLTTARTGTGSGTLSASGLSCSGPSCSGTYSYNTSVTLNARPATGSTFSGWTGCRSTSGNTCTVIMTGVKRVGGAFTLVPYMGSKPPMIPSAISLDFGAVQLGAKKTKTLTIDNHGTGELVLGLGKVTGDTAGFSIPNTYEAIDPRGRYQYSFTYAPVSYGTARAVVTIPSNASRGWITVNLEGTCPRPE